MKLDDGWHPINLDPELLAASERAGLDELMLSVARREPDDLLDELRRFRQSVG